MNYSIDLEMLESMRYSDLQKLAKSFGIKANMKMDKLLKALRDHVADKATRSSPKTKAEPVTKVEAVQDASEAEKSAEKPKRGRKPKVEKAKEVAKEEEAERETSPQPIPPRKFFATPKSNTSTAKRFSVASRTPPMTSGIKRLSQITPRGLKTKSNTPCTPASLQKRGKRQRTSTSDNQGSAKRQKKSTGETSEPKVFVTDRQKKSSAKKSPEKKRRSSTRLSGKGVSSGSGKKQPVRRRTYDKEEASPGVKEIIGSLKSNMTVQEMKTSLMMSLDKKVKIAAKPDTHDDKPVSQIPRFAAYLAARKKQAEENKKPITPGNKDWTKLHEKRFNKMDSIAKFLEKKKGRQMALTNSTKKAQLVAEQTRSALKSLKDCRTPPTSSKKPFVPQATSLAQINTNFSAMKSPARKSVKKVTLGTPASSTKENKATRKSDVQKRKSAVTPFKAGSMNTSNLNTTHNTTMDSTTKSATKKSFNLAASLAKPVTWKAHTGKLKPFGMGNLYQVREVRENKGNIKEVKVTTRDVRRNIAHGKRADHRSAAQMKRRGIC